MLKSLESTIITQQKVMGYNNPKILVKIPATWSQPLIWN